MDKPESTTFRWCVLLLVMSGVFLSTMDSGMVSVALPTIMRSYNVDLRYSELVVSLYLFTITVSLVLWGKLADMVGRINIYLVGMATFAVGALSCYFSATFLQLLAFRVLQGLGASMMMSSGPAIIKSIFPGDYLGRSLGLVGIATACGLLTGPFVSGQLLNLFTWKTIFLITLPVNIVALLLGLYLFRKHLIIEDFGIDTLDFDWRGCACWICLVSLWLVFFHRLNNFFSIINGVLLLLFIILLLYFLRLEKNTKSPILPIFLFEKRDYWTGVLTAAISFAALFSVLVLIPFYLEYIFGFNVEKVGIVMMAMPATIVVFSPFSGWLYDKIGARFLASFGLGLGASGILSLAFITPQSSITELMLKLSVVGAGQSIFLSPNSASVLANVSDKYIGISAGILATARNFGMVSGATLAVALFSVFYRLLGDGRLVTDATVSDASVFLVAWKCTFIVVAAISFFATFLSLRRGNC